jgi:hypothetical protein
MTLLYTANCVLILREMVWYVPFVLENAWRVARLESDCCCIDPPTSRLSSSSKPFTAAVVRQLLLAPGGLVHRATRWNGCEQTRKSAEIRLGERRLD